MGIFSGRHFPREIILWAVRWYCRYGVSYRDLEEMMTERGVPVDHTTILTAGSRNTALSWISTLGGTGRFLTGRPVPGGWMRPTSGSGESGATSIGRSPPVARPWTFTSLRSRTWPQRSVSWPRPSDPIRQPGPRGSSTPTRHQLWPRPYPS